jgi:SH3-like domain-containing protein
MVSFLGVNIRCTTQPTAGIILALALLLVFASVAISADTLTITAQQAAVRVRPDIKQAILSTVPQGAMFSLLERHQQWYKILLDDGREGWVAQAAARVQSERGFVVPPTTSAGQARAALVIGNAAYSADIGPLKNPVAYSARKLPPVPYETCHRFHAKLATDSRAKLPRLPRQLCHCFRTKVATP